MKQTDRIVRRKQQIAGTLRYIENEKQTVEREILTMDRDARARRLVLLEYFADRCQRHHDRLARAASLRSRRLTEEANHE